MVASTLPYGRQVSRIPASPSAASLRTFLAPRSPSMRSVATGDVAIPGQDAPLGREQRAELTRQLERMHKPYLALTETHEQRRDLQALMARTVDQLSARGVSWPRLKHYFEFNRTLENTRCGMAGTGNASVFAVGGLMADLYAAEPLSAALDRRGIDSARKAAILGAAISAGVLYADGVLSPAIVQGMLGAGYVPSDSVRPSADPDAPPRFATAFDEATKHLNLRTPAVATAQLKRSLQPYTTRNKGLIGFKPALEMLDIPPAKIDKAFPYAQNLLGLPAGATGALLVASDERKSLHRSDLAYLYRLPPDGQDPVESLMANLHRVEGSWLLMEQAKEIGKGVAGAAVQLPIYAFVPPALAPTRFGGIHSGDATRTMIEKWVPPGMRALVSPGAVIPAAVFGAGAGVLSWANSHVVGPAAQALTGSNPLTAGQERSNRMVRSVAEETTTMIVKDALYKTLAETAVGTSVAMGKLNHATRHYTRAPENLSEGPRINAAGTSVLALDIDVDRPRPPAPRRDPLPRLGSFSTLSERSSVNMPASIDSSDELFPARSSRSSLLGPRSPRPPRPMNAATASGLVPAQASNAAPVREARRLETGSPVSATTSV